MHRLVNKGRPLKAKTLFEPDEREALARAFSAVTGTAELLGRSRIRMRQMKRAAGMHLRGQDPTPFGEVWAFSEIEEFCGGPGSGRPGPCPEGGGDDGGSGRQPAQQTLEDYKRSLNVKADAADDHGVAEASRNAVDPIGSFVHAGEKIVDRRPGTFTYTNPTSGRSFTFDVIKTEHTVPSISGRRIDKTRYLAVAPGSDVPLAGLVYRNDMGKVVGAYNHEGKIGIVQHLLGQLEADGNQATPSEPVTNAGARAMHRYHISKAIAAGQAVPAEVLKDYPDLAAKVTKHAELHRFADPPLVPLPPRQAVDYFKRLIPKIGVDPERWGEAMERHAFTLAEDTEGVVLERVQDAIAARLESGIGVSDAPAEIQAILDEAGLTPRNPQYSEMVWRTNALDAYNTGASREMAHPDVREEFPVWQYLGIDDERQRERHRIHNDQYYPAERSFAEVRDSQLGSYDGFNCVLPGTAASGRFVGGFKAWYDGEAIEIQTASGRRLAVTTNHPILTTSGFVAAGRLRKGDHLLNCRGEGERPTSVVGEHHEHVPSKIEDVLESLAISRGTIVSQASVTALDFHGDAIYFDGDVDVVRPEVFAQHDAIAGRLQSGGQAAIGGPNVGLLEKPRLRSLSLNLRRIGLSSSGTMGGCHLVTPAVGVGDLRPLQLLSIGRASSLDAARCQSANDRGAADRELYGELVHRFAGVVAADHVVSIERFSYSGHVYDLTTDVGYYSANGIIISNCRCTFAPISAEEWEDLQAGGARLSRFAEVEEFCGGPGSGRPGPCPEGGSVDSGPAVRQRAAPEAAPAGPVAAKPAQPAQGGSVGHVVTTKASSGGAVAPAAAERKPSKTGDDHPTKSPQFKSWFGDWEADPGSASQVVDPETGDPQEEYQFAASQVVDDQGKPQVVFHGTPKGGFESFDPGELGKRTGAKSALKGFFFSDKKEVAETYASVEDQIDNGGPLVSSIADIEDKLARLEDWYSDPEHAYANETDEGEWEAKVIGVDDFGDTFEWDDGFVYDDEDEALEAARVLMEKELADQQKHYNDRLDDMKADRDRAIAEASKHAKVYETYLNIRNPLVHDFAGGDYKDHSFTKLLEDAQADGHDGVLMKNVRDSFDSGETVSNVWIAFDPKQIKAAKGNKGTFDPTDSNIYHAESIEAFCGGPGSGRPGPCPTGRKKYIRKGRRRSGAADVEDMRADAQALAPTQKVFGHSLTSVVRYLGREGWNVKEVRAVLNHLGYQTNDNTLRMNIGAGKQAGRTDHAPLKDEDKAKLADLRKQHGEGKLAPGPELPPTPPPKPRPKKDKPAAKVGTAAKADAAHAALVEHYQSRLDDQRDLGEAKMNAERKYENYKAHLGSGDSTIATRTAAFEEYKQATAKQRELQKKIEKHAAAARKILHKNFAAGKDDRATPPSISATSSTDVTKKMVKNVEDAAAFVEPLLHFQGEPKREIKVTVARNGRAYASNAASGFAFVALDKKDDMETAVHEYGHTIEYHIPDALQKTTAFWEKRCGKDAERSMNDVAGGGYEADEKGRKDRFEAMHKNDMNNAYYTGKVYRRADGSIRSTEILSQGLERLYADPAHFAKADPEYFHLIVGILGGHKT